MRLGMTSNPRYELYDLFYIGRFYLMALELIPVRFSQ
jgi:hypothetical protein